MGNWLNSAASDVQLLGCDAALLHATPLHATPMHPRLQPASMAVAASHSLLDALLAAVGACSPSAVADGVDEYEVEYFPETQVCGAADAIKL